MDVYKRYDDIPDREKVFSPDKTKAAAFYVSSTRSDRYEDEATYDVAVWKTKTKEKIVTLTRTHRVDDYLGKGLGAPVRAIRFVANNELEIEYSDGTKERAGVPNERPAPMRDPAEDIPLVRKKPHPK